MSKLYVDLAIPGTVGKTFTYAVPPELEPAAKERVRALVHFGKRSLVGFIVRRSTVPPNISHVKPVINVLDDKPIMSEELFALTKWMSEYYFAPWGDVLKAVLVQGAAPAGERVVSLVSADERGKLSVSSSGKAIVDELMKSGNMSLTRLKKKVGSASFYQRVNELAQQGHITIDAKLPELKIKPRVETIVTISDEMTSRWQGMLDGAGNRIGSRQRALIHTLIERLKEHSSFAVGELLKRSGASMATLKALEKKQLLIISKTEVLRSEIYESEKSFSGVQAVTLNEDQTGALRNIHKGLEANTFRVYLLHGVTGSGKTQVYIEAVQETLSRGKSAIVLVPEISLTSQIVRRFRFHFGEQVVAIHSRMSAGERYDAWRLVREGKRSIVIGPRSAVFAPLHNIGLIVVDEEQEAAYKQYDQSPRYHARDVAIMRARGSNAVVILGSATPSFESYTNALEGKYSLLEMQQRVDGAQLPSIHVIDMASERRIKLAAFRERRKDEFAKDPVKAREMKQRFNFSMISDVLREKIDDRLTKKEGVILLQNRRGFSPFIECPDCGYAEMCENCSITLNYHRVQQHLRCHYCGFTKLPPERCIKCGGSDILYRGIGTQRVEEELKILFPFATMVRMDMDTTSRKKSHDTILQKFSDGEADILLGTQMVAKGLDFSRVTLVGVIAAETQMLLPDFRSSERTFQLLTQVAGRAGRSSLKGEVVIQTYLPEHETLTHVIAHDFKGFYLQEMEYRKELSYAPFSQMIIVEFRGQSQEEVLLHANKFSEILRCRDPHLMLLGPAPAVITKLRRMIRWQIIIKNLKKNDLGGKKIQRLLNDALFEYENSTLGKNRSVKLILDVDPTAMM